MTAVAKLLPCPFCGSQPKSGWQGASVPGMEDCGYWGIDCCNAFAHAGSEQDAAAQWNRRAALSPAELGGVEWPKRMVNLPCPNGTTDRIVGFRVEEGSPILGKFGLSEPLEWLRNVTVDRTTPRAAEAGRFEVFAREFGVDLTPFPDKLPNPNGLRFNYQQANDAWKAWVAALTPPSAKGE